MEVKGQSSQNGHGWPRNKWLILWVMFCLSNEKGKESVSDICFLLNYESRLWISRSQYMKRPWKYLLPIFSQIQANTYSLLPASRLTVSQRDQIQSTQVTLNQLNVEAMWLINNVCSKMLLAMLDCLLITLGLYSFHHLILDWGCFALFEFVFCFFISLRLTQSYWRDNYNLHFASLVAFLQFWSCEFQLFFDTTKLLRVCANDLSDLVDHIISNGGSETPCQLHSSKCQQTM